MRSRYLAVHRHVWLRRPGPSRLWKPSITSSTRFREGRSETSCIPVLPAAVPLHRLARGVAEIQARPQRGAHESDPGQRSVAYSRPFQPTHFAWLPLRLGQHLRMKPCILIAVTRSRSRWDHCFADRIRVSLLALLLFIARSTPASTAPNIIGVAPTMRAATLRHAHAHALVRALLFALRVDV